MGTSRPGPLAHDALVCVDAPGMAICPRDGQLRGAGVTGVFHDGLRLLSRSVVTVGGAEPEPLAAQLVGAGAARFLGMLRFVADPSPDPAVVVERTRHADGAERLVLRSTARRPLRLRVEFALGTDLTTLTELRGGRTGGETPARVGARGLAWTAPDGLGVRAVADPAPHTVLAAGGVLRWDVELAPGASWAARLSLVPQTPPGRIPGPRAVTGSPPWADLKVRCDDARVAAWAHHGLAELRGLLVADSREAGTPLPATGAPWQLTPTGRDALWVARMLLPLGTRLAGATLRRLAAAQGVTRDPRTGEAPGRIPHTLDRGAAGPRYECAGSTALFVTLLGEARRWGLPAAETEALLPHLLRALCHLEAEIGARDGFVRLGPGGPAPAELQGQVHEAAVHAAVLLGAYGIGDAGAWAEHAADLARRFRVAFRVEDASGPYFAAALDPSGRPVPVPSATLGLLPGTGILDDGGCADVARRLLSPDLDTGWGLRGTSCRTPGYHPFAVRGGVVRAHDTCAVIAGLASRGLVEPAGELFAGLVDAAAAFGFRMPEMHAGEQRLRGHAPVAHPLACRPAARAAAAVVPVLVAFAGLHPDAPARRVVVRPPGVTTFGELELRDLRIAGEPFTVRLNRAGQAVVEAAAAGLQLAV